MQGHRPKQTDSHKKYTIKPYRGSYRSQDQGISTFRSGQDTVIEKLIRICQSERSGALMNLDLTSRSVPKENFLCHIMALSLSNRKRGANGKRNL
jgi:hypothetical protein